MKIWCPINQLSKPTIMYENRKLRNVCFTANNQTVQEFLAKQTETLGFTYLKFSQEIAPTTGTPHLQGYGQSQWPIRRLMKKFGIHVEPMYGSREKNDDYVTKAGPALEHGQWHDLEPGHRTDIDDMKQMVLAGCTPRDLWMRFPGQMLHASRYIYDMLEVLGPSVYRRSTSRRVLNLYGASGIGKTQMAINTFELQQCPFFVLSTSDNTMWWRGYWGQPGVLINDYRGGMKYNTLINILDPWHNERVHLMSGGSTIPMTADLVIITSIQKWDKWYPNIADQSELARRVTIATLLPIVTSPQNEEPTYSTFFSPNE